MNGHPLNIESAPQHTETTSTSTTTTTTPAASMSGSSGEGSSGNNRSMQSRTGRTKQRYNSKGERLVAGVVPLSPDRNYVILIQSTRRKGWVLPKGGWESDESCEESAVREAWEEAGITVQIDYDLGNFEEKRPPKTSKERSRYYFYQGTVLNEMDDWPERHKREREWFTYTQALEVLSTRPELQEALNRSSMNRT